MSGITVGDRPSEARKGGFGLFLRRWAANPLQMGSVVPSSRALGRRIAGLIERSGDEVVVELGAGTGAVSRALLDGGVIDEARLGKRQRDERHDHAQKQRAEQQRDHEREASAR